MKDLRSKAELDTELQDWRDEEHRKRREKRKAPKTPHDKGDDGRAGDGMATSLSVATATTMPRSLTTTSPAPGRPTGAGVGGVGGSGAAVSSAADTAVTFTAMNPMVGTAAGSGVTLTTSDGNPNANGTPVDGGVTPSVTEQGNHAMIGGL